MARSLVLLAALALSLSCLGVQGQHSSAAGGEWLPGTARIIIADNTENNTQLVAVDLPAFTVTHRISTPGAIQSIGLTVNNEFAGVFRARANNDQHFLTFVHTGIKPLSGFAAPRSAAAATVPGYMRKMVTAKTLIAYNGTDTTGGVESNSELVYHPRWKTNLMYSEAHGLVIAYNAATAANPAAAFRATTRSTIPPGHFHLTPVNNYVLAPHTTGSLALILDSAGKIAFSQECGLCHGSEAYEVSQTRAVALFGCNTTVLAVTINTSGARPTFTPVSIPAVDPRIGSFIAGAPGVFWTAANPPLNVTAPEQTTGTNFFYRTDVRSASYAITKVNHPGSGLAVNGRVLRAIGVPASQRMLAFHRVGLLVMYNGVTGAAVGNVTISSTPYSLDAVAPFMIVHGSKVYVSVPATGRLHEIDVNFTTGRMSVRRSVAVGGVPGTLAVADQAAL